MIESTKTVCEKLNKFMPGYKEHDFIEVTEWTNGEGWYININDKKLIALHYSELEAINYLTKALEYEGV